MSNPEGKSKESELIETPKNVVEKIGEKDDDDENMKLLDLNQDINIGDLGIDFDGFRKNKSIEFLKNLTHGGFRIATVLLVNIGIYIYERLVRETNIGHVFLVVFIYDAFVILEAVLHVILMFTCKSKCFNRP